MPDRSEEVADRLRLGVEALRAERWADAAEHLVAVADDRELAAAEDLADLRCRAMSLAAQATWRAGRTAEALGRADRALALARRLGDAEGVVEITELRAAIGRDASAATPAPGLARTPDERGLAVATEAVETGRLADAATVLEPLRRSEVPRIAVLSRLLSARAEPARAPQHLAEAAEWARSADEFALLGAVVRTAELLGVPIAALDEPPR